MKKLLSALLIATLLIASVACVFAIADEAEGDTATDPVLVDILGQIKAADTEDATVVVNADGTVTVTAKRAASQAEPIVLIEALDGTTFDATKAAYLVISFETTGDVANTDFRAHYTRKDKAAAGTVADSFFSGAKGDTANVKESGDGLVIWDIATYLNVEAKLIPEGHEFKDLHLVNAAEGDEITIKAYAITSTPAVPAAKAPATSEGSTSSEDEATSSEDEATSSEDNATSSEESVASSTETSAPAASSSEAPTTGDNGLIVFAVLAVVALAGGIVVVRARG